MIFTALEPKDWGEVETSLTDAFRRSQAAARDGEPVIFVLSQEDLLGQRGAPGAILANALLSGMRTLAAEGVQANAVAVGPDADPEDLQHWIAQLEAGRGVTGELDPRTRQARGQDPGMRSAIVTGAARGIGAAVADRLSADHDVLRVDIDPSVDGLVADVTNPDDRARIVEAAGEVSVLVNNAGITRDARIVKMTEEDFLAVIRINLGAAYELTRACRFADGASVVSLASRAYLGNFGQFNYSMSKGGLVGMTRALALELAPRVRVNAIAPSLTASEMTRGHACQGLGQDDREHPARPPGRTGGDRGDDRRAGLAGDGVRDGPGRGRLRRPQPRPVNLKRTLSGTVPL